MGRRPTVAKDIADGLRAGISAGVYAPRELLPTQDEIRAMFASPDDGTVPSRAAVIKAIDILADDGLVKKIRNVGARVTPQIPHKTGIDRATTARRTGRIYDSGEYAVITAELVTAPPGVTAGLGLEPGAQVIRRHRATYNADGTIESVSTSWYDGAYADTAPRLLSAERIVEGSWSYLEAQTGRRAVRWEELVKAREATEEEAEELGIVSTHPVKVATLILRDAAGGVIEYGVSVAVAGREAKYEGIIPD